MNAKAALKKANETAESIGLSRDFDDVMKPGEWEDIAIAKLRELGWVLAPLEPTEAMFAAAGAPVDGNTQAIAAVYDCYRAMIEEAGNE